ncbi:hypothetical protein B0H16DRAFT_1780711 [Mycena metata]|uniref:Uncharacterized protein n=1 Tax=Mycena metata TaxID=1033252 RepID=A0AAD7HQQ7_9AGAR|nr:hypothetical protein B0H16DRAFT_1780711 [Mycena metata]
MRLPLSSGFRVLDANASATFAARRMHHPSYPVNGMRRHASDPARADATRNERGPLYHSGSRLDYCASTFAVAVERSGKQRLKSMQVSPAGAVLVRFRRTDPTVVELLRAVIVRDVNTFAGVYGWRGGWRFARSTGDGRSDWKIITGGYHSQPFLMANFEETVLPQIIPKASLPFLMYRQESGMLVPAILLLDSREHMEEDCQKRILVVGPLMALLESQAGATSQYGGKYRRSPNAVSKT